MAFTMLSLAAGFFLFRWISSPGSADIPVRLKGTAAFWPRTLTALLLCLLSTPVFTSATELVSTYSTWRFRKGYTEASAPASAWRAASFNDASAGFTDAPAPFWYGDARSGGTELVDMMNSYSCIFLRHTFTIDSVTNIASLQLRAYVDDGFIAWINGVEVARTNMPSGEPTYSTLAEDAFEPPPFATYNLPPPGSYLTPGTNVLAIQVFNTTLASSDLAFDCLLEATEAGSAALPGDLAITEILAANVSTNGLADEDGQQQDWIEIQNRSTNSVDLANWSLSDDPALPGLWTFPPRILAPGEFLVVFASAKDRRPANTGALHTNFKLSRSGEHLGLYAPGSPRVLAAGFTPYPEQRNDISYGYDPSGTLRYFATPTPGAPNGPSTIVGVCAPVHVNVSRGHFTAPFDLVLSCATPGAELRYTTNGSEPAAGSPLFPGSLRITSTTLFRAAAFKASYLPSKTATHSYLFNLSPALRSLPVISLVTASNNILGPTGILGIQGGFYDPNQNGEWVPLGPDDYHNPSQSGLAWERPVSVEWIRPEDNSGFQADCGIRVHGSDTTRTHLTPASKFSFRLAFRSDYGPGALDYPFFPLTPVRQFDQLVLRGGVDDQDNPFIRDEVHRRLSHDMGQIASHGALAVLFLNGILFTNSPFYNPVERVDAGFFHSHLGGGSDWDVVGPPGADGGAIDGTPDDFQDLVNYVAASNPANSAVYTTISRWLDLTNFVDYLLLNTYGAMGDWPYNNWRAGRDQGTNGLWRFVVWDAEYGMGLDDRNVLLNSFEAELYWSSCEITTLYHKLYTSPEFKLLWADRVQKHFFNGGALTSQNISNRCDELRAQLSALIPAMDTEFLEWAGDRQPIFFDQMRAEGLLASTPAPGFNQFGGPVPAGFNLLITNASGTIYFTTNGADPRVMFTGAVSPSARAYSQPLPLNSTVTVRARALQGSSWSALTEATFTVGSLGIPVRITELMYNPPGGSLYEFVELQNISPIPVDLGGMYFDGITFTFPQGAALAGGARLVLGANTDTNAWKALYPGVNPFGWFSGSLNNAGERITLFDRFGQIITSADYKDSGGWPVAADGAGRSLELINPNGDPDDPANWQASAAANGTPGAPNSPPPAQPVFLNEVMAANLNAVPNGSTFPDWIEIANPGSTPVSLAGWSLTDDGNARKFVFPAGTTIAGPGYLVVWCDAATNTTPGLHAGFALDTDGESVFLYDAATNRIDAISFGPQLTNYSIGRISGIWVLTTPTPNAANAAAALASPANLVLNEWLANPLPGGSDWLELFNRSATLPVSLQGIYLASSNSLHRLTSLSFLPPLGHFQLFADEGVGPTHLDFKLPAAGSLITLSDATGALLDSVAYDAQTENLSQGRLPDGSANIVSFPGSMSPGAANYLNTYTGPIINEVLARNHSLTVNGQIVDWFEIVNPAPTNFSLAGMSVSVNSQKPGQWVFPAGCTLAPNAFLLVKCDGSSPASTNAGNFNTGKSLDGDSGGVYLFAASGQLVSSVEYGPQIEDLSIGLSAGQWRLLSAPTPAAPNAAAAPLGPASALRLNEWMAAPDKGADWFELFNLTNLPVSLDAIALSDDPSMAGERKFIPAPLSFIAPNGFVKWVADSSPGQGRNHVNFALNADGDSLLLHSLTTTNVTLIDSLAFGAQAPGVSSGRLPDGAASLSAFPGSPSPAESNYRLLPNVLINEALAHTDPPLEDAIELYNPTASPVNIGGWFLSNTRFDRRKFRIPDPAEIPAGGYRVLYEYQFNQGSNAFTLNSAHGDEICLSAALNGLETGDRALVQFGASFNGVSFGRVLTSVGVDFMPLNRHTFGVDNPATLAQFRTGNGLPNAGPSVGPVVITELLYHPPGGANGTNEFIELHNPGAAAVPLYDPAFPTNHWKLAGGVQFTFPSGVTLAPGACLLVVDFDPVANPAALAAFRALYHLSANVPVFGPFSGALANDQDTVELYRPDTPQHPPSPDAGFVPCVIVDRVSYTDAPPWPTASPDGGGASLQRIDPAAYGNEPLNWLAAAPTPGSAAAALVDTDDDGIPDAAELRMGLDPNNPADAAADPDGDGLTNYQEYIAGTDHLDPNSCLRFTEIRGGENLVLTFEAIANRTYSLLYSDSLTNSVWSKLVDVLAQTTTQPVSITNAPAAASTRFYRLVTPAQP